MIATSNAEISGTVVWGQGAGTKCNAQEKVFGKISKFVGSLYIMFLKIMLNYACDNYACGKFFHNPDAIVRHIREIMSKHYMTLCQR